jgi:hypothetical protein
VAKDVSDTNGQPSLESVDGGTKLLKHMLKSVIEYIEQEDPFIDGEAREMVNRLAGLIE